MGVGVQVAVGVGAGIKVGVRVGVEARLSALGAWPPGSGLTAAPPIPDPMEEGAGALPQAIRRRLSESQKYSHKGFKGAPSYQALEKNATSELG